VRGAEPSGLSKPVVETLGPQAGEAVPAAPPKPVAQQKLQASDAASGDLFGSSVALSQHGDVALVGADGKDVHAGAAYIFTSGKG
jgi:hypothetical protein